MHDDYSPDIPNRASSATVLDFNFAKSQDEFRLCEPEHDLAASSLATGAFRGPTPYECPDPATIPPRTPEENERQLKWLRAVDPAKHDGRKFEERERPVSPIRDFDIDAVERAAAEAATQDVKDEIRDIREAFPGCAIAPVPLDPVTLKPLVELRPEWPKWKAPQSEAGAEDLGEWDAGEDMSDIPPRGWLLGNQFCRGVVSSLIADGGIGKSTLRLAQLLSLATGKALTGEYVFVRCRVLIVSLEDDKDELRRRVRAACLHHGIDQSELKGWLYLASPGAAGGKILTADKFGRPLKGKLADKIAHTVERRSIDIVSIDPFVKSHSVEENNNSLIDEVVQVLSDLAIRFNLALDAPHHTNKGPATPGNANRGRGASAMKDAARLVYTLTPMSPEEGEAFGLEERDRCSLLRLDKGKVNTVPPWYEAKWFRLVGVNIGNPSERYPNGDEVQTVELWKPPRLFDDLDVPTINLILGKITIGLPPDGKQRYSDSRNTPPDRAAWCVVQEYCPRKTEAACKRVIKVWLDSGLLIQREYINPATRNTVKGLWVDDSKRPT
jgi:hypothetical protein